MEFWKQTLGTTQNSCWRAQLTTKWLYWDLPQNADLSQANRPIRIQYLLPKGCSLKMWFFLIFWSPSYSNEMKKSQDWLLGLWNRCSGELQNGHQEPDGSIHRLGITDLERHPYLTYLMYTFLLNVQNIIPKNEKHDYLTVDQHFPFYIRIHKKTLYDPQIRSCSIMHFTVGFLPPQSLLRYSLGECWTSGTLTLTLWLLFHTC